MAMSRQTQTRPAIEKAALKCTKQRRALVAPPLLTYEISERMPQSCHDAELPHARRTLTAFRRRHGILPSPAVKLLEQLRQLTAAQPAVQSAT